MIVILFMLELFVFYIIYVLFFFFFFQAEDGIRDADVTGVQTCALPISQAMSTLALERAQEVADKVTTALGGCGIFGVELFIKGDEVIFNEVSPRPHDTGLVTLISQDLSEFALHTRAILGLPIPNIVQHGPSASAVLLVEGESNNIRYSGLDKALAEVNTQLRLFGKPEVSGKRRMGVGLARGENTDDARAKALNVIKAISVSI